MFYKQDGNTVFCKRQTDKGRVIKVLFVLLGTFLITKIGPQYKCFSVKGLVMHYCMDPKFSSMLISWLNRSYSLQISYAQYLTRKEVSILPY